MKTASAAISQQQKGEKEKIRGENLKI